MTTGAAFVADLLLRAGVRVGYAYPGTSELALCVELSKGLAEGLLQPYGDGAAIFMGAGACAAEPGSSVSVVHGARGLGAACGAIADVARNEWGLIVIAGLPSTATARFLPPHGEPNMVAAVGGFTKGWLDLGTYKPADVSQPAIVADVLLKIEDLVAAASQTPAGPVLIGLPQDLAEMHWADPDASHGASPSESAPATTLNAEELRSAARLLKASSRTGIIVDDYFLRLDGAQEALAKFSVRYSAPVFQVGYRRGPMLFENLNPKVVTNYLGRYAPEHELVGRFARTVDLLVTIEDRNMYPRVVGPLPDCRKIALTSSLARTGKNEYLEADDVVIEGDAVTALTWLAGEAQEPRQDDNCWLSRSRPSSPAAPSTPPPAACIAGAVLQALVSAGLRVLVDDSQALGGALASFGEQALLNELEIFGDHGGYVGSGLAFAAGLALARRQQVACLLGDHAFANGVQGLFAVARYRAPVCFLVSSNGGSITLAQQARDSFGDEAGLATRELMLAPDLNITALARSVGILGAQVDFRGRDDLSVPMKILEDHLHQIVHGTAPAIIELCMPDDVQAWSGVWHSRGLDE